MKCLPLILAIAGLSCGLQAPLHYRYKYFGSVFTGIPELSNQAAGWAMKADVEVYIEKDDGHAVFQIHDLKMVEYNGDLGCDVRGDVPEDLFHPIEDQTLAHAVETPFRVHLFDHEEHYVIEHTKDKFDWLTNMRKGIASVFKNEILRGNIDKQIEGTIAAALHKGHVINVFNVQEETAFGNCKVDYTVYPIPDQLAGTRNHELRDHIEVDVQLPKESDALTGKKKSKTSKKSKTKTGKLIYAGAKLEKDLYHVVRSVDFDHCEEVVALQTAAVGINTELHGGQHEWIKGRSSVTEFIFRGGPGHARMEKAIVEGAATKSPLGFKTEVLQARVNQTFELVSVTAGGEVPAPTGDLHKHDTWLHEVYSPYETPKVSKVHPWVIYTGKGDKIKDLQVYGYDAFTPEVIAEIKDSIITYIKHAAKILTDADQEEPVAKPGETIGYVEKASVLFKHLDKADVLKIFDHFFSKELEHKDTLAKKLVVDAAATSGVYPAHSAILEYIKQKKIPKVQIMTIAMTITSNIQSPTILPEILDYALSLSLKDEPFLTATVFINFAELVDDLCIRHHAREVHYAGPLYGDHGCDHTMKDRFLPYLKDVIYDDSTTWEKDVAIQTLHNLGSVYILPILVPVIEGKVGCSPRVRAMAIYALDSWKLQEHGHVRTQVMDLLTDVYSDVGEDAEVREAALTTIVTWQPDASFWHRLARTSWREPSRQFTSFISALIDSFAHFQHPRFLKQSQAALHAVKFTKPIAPAMKYSYIQIMTKRLVDKHLSKYQHFSWHSTERSYNSKEFYYFLMTNLGGFEFVNMELFSIAEGFFERFGKILKDKEEAEGYGGIAAKIAGQFYSKIQETIGAKTIHHDVTPKIDVFLRLFDHMNLFLPLNAQTLGSDNFLASETIAQLAIQLGLGYDLVLGKFFQPFDIHVAEPTEIGLPLFTTSHTPIMLSDSTFTTLGLGGKSPGLESLKKMELSIETLTTIASEGHSSLNILLPWSHHMVGTGIRATRDIKLPLHIVLRRTQHEDEGAHHQITHVDFQSRYNKKFPMIQATNIPYTAITPALPLKSKDNHNFKVITHSKPKEKVMHLPHAYSGLNFDFTWKSEMALPFTLFNFEQFIRHPESILASPWLMYSLATPTVHYWSANLEFDPQNSETKNITVELVMGTFGKETKAEVQETDGQFSQYGQETFEQYDQEPNFDIDQGFETVGGQSEVETVHFGDSMKQRSQKMQEYFGGTAYTKSLKVDFSGDKHRQFEIIYSYSIPKVIGSRKQRKSQLSIVRSAIPGIDDHPSAVCLDVKKELPVFSKLDTVKALLSANLDKDVTADLTIDCKGEPVAHLKGKYHLSDAWKEKLQHEIPKECDYDRHTSLYTLHSHAVYDDLKYTLTWDKVCDVKKHPLTTAVIDVAEEIIGIALHKVRCSTGEPEHKVEVDAHRCHESGNWYINAKREDAELHLEEIAHNNYFNFLYGIGEKLFEYHPEHTTTFNLESEICTIGNHEVRTFDGFVYELEPTSCWTVAAEDCHRDHGWMLLIRASEGESLMPDAKFIDMRRGLVIEYSKHTVKVNGKVVDPVGEHEVIRDDNGHIILVVHKKNDYHMVQFTEDFYIAATENLEVHIPNDMWGDMCGLCGNHDGEPESEFVGPHRCFYDDARTFAAAWSGESDTCDLYTLHALREETNKIQSDNCRTIESLHEHCPAFNKRCYEFGWLIQKHDDDKLCVSAAPLPHCEEGCEWHSTHDEIVEFNCWPVDHAPHELTEAIKQGTKFIVTPISHEPYIYDQYIHVILPDSCKHY